jgi:hypothetical protein
MQEHTVSIKDLIPGKLYYVTYKFGGAPRREMVALYVGMEGPNTRWSLRPMSGIQIIHPRDLIKVSGPTNRKLMKPRRLGD